MNKKPKIIFLSANAFSGSTIFSLFLGKHSNITNLGEVINLEHDYNENLICTCGDRVFNCTYWHEIKEKLNQSISKGLLNFSLSSNKKRSLIDKKGLSFKKLLILLGFSPQVVYGEESINNYIEKNINFFKEIDKYHNRSKYIVDSSKPPERLDILLESSEIDIYCIYLKRNLKSLFDSNIKREKKTRKIIGFKFYRELILLYFREKHRRKVFNKVKEGNKLTVDFENFKNNPQIEYSRVLNFLKCSPNSSNEFDRNLEIKKQHIYVGNRWIFNKKNEKIILETENTKHIKKGYFETKLVDLVFKNYK